MEKPFPIPQKNNVGGGFERSLHRLKREVFGLGFFNEMGFSW